MDRRSGACAALRLPLLFLLVILAEDLLLLWSAHAPYTAFFSAKSHSFANLFSRASGVW